MKEKLSAEELNERWKNRSDNDSLYVPHGQAWCNRCDLVYPLGTTHRCYQIREPEPRQKPKE